MREQWYVLYTEWGRVLRATFGDDEAEAVRFAEVTEDAKVYYGYC